MDEVEIIFNFIVLWISISSFIKSPREAVLLSIIPSLPLLSFFAQFFGRSKNDAKFLGVNDVEL